MFRRVLLIGIVMVAFTFSASACEKCAQYWDWQAENWCLYCEYAYCGWFACNVYQSSWGFDYCDSPYGSNDYGCFEYGGRNTCGPDVQSRLTPMKAPQREWQLVRVTITTPKKHVRRG